jgi:acetoacetyl-CoA synthetase
VARAVHTAATPLWRPSPELVERSGFARYLAWLHRERGIVLADYGAAWEWSTREIEAFWASVWDFFDVRATKPYDTVLAERRMPGARWFTGAELNYAEHAFRHATASRPALLFRSETRASGEVTWAELRANVAALAAALRELGVRRGDAVVAYLPNLPEAVEALLACASIGAIWAACSPELGTRAVSERFRPLEPRVLIAVDGYRYAGKPHDRRAAVLALRQALPTLQHTVLVPYLDSSARLDGTLDWHALLARETSLEFEPVPFEHPLWVLYSSGTTGVPKAIVHGHGGILLEHLKSHVLQNDMRPGDRFLWHTTTGWMMWNLLVGALLAGGIPVLYDGAAQHPSLLALWQLVDELHVARFGAGAAYHTACMKAGLRPGQHLELAALRTIGSTGSPLPADAFTWIYDAVKRDVWLASSSGGTEVCTAFLCACPGLPVHAGELQGPALGARVCAFDERGAPVVDEVGELVITEPMPSMPLFLWDDPDGERYRASYFSMYPGIWRHGDRVHFTSRGSAVIHGRSDATLNRHGVRIGSGEIYGVVEALPEVTDSLVVGIDRPDGSYFMPLFVVLADGVVLDEALRHRIAERIRADASPRHVPDAIVQVPAVPRTLTGKKLEVPIKRILLGEPVERVLDAGALADADALHAFIELAAHGLGSGAPNAPTRARDD